MARIEYDDGLVIEFEGDPTPDQIEEAYALERGSAAAPAVEAPAAVQEPPSLDLEGIRQQQHATELQAAQQQAAEQQRAAQLDADPRTWSTTRLKDHFKKNAPRNIEEQAQMNALLQSAKQREDQLTAQLLGQPTPEQEAQAKEQQKLAQEQQERDATLGETIRESGKAAGQAALGFEQAVGSVVKWAGDAMLEASKRLEGSRGDARSPVTEKATRAVDAAAQQITFKLGSYLTQLGETSVSFWKEKRSLPQLKRDPEFWSGRYTQHNTWQKTAALTASAIPSLGAAMGMTAMTGNPWAGAGTLGVIYGADEYQAARDAGKDFGQASLVGAANVVVNTITEQLPLRTWLKLKGTKALTRATVVGAQEGLEEVVQQLWTNAVAKHGYDATREYFDGVATSFVAGAASGGILGALEPGAPAKIDAFEQKLVEGGMTPEQVEVLRTSVGEQIVAKADTINVTLDKTRETTLAPPGAEKPPAPKGKEAVAPAYDFVKTFPTPTDVAIKEGVAERDLGENYEDPAAVQSQHEELIKELRYIQEGLPLLDARIDELTKNPKLSKQRTALVEERNELTERQDSYFAQYENLYGTEALTALQQHLAQPEPEAEASAPSPIATELESKAKKYKTAAEFVVSQWGKRGTYQEEGNLYSVAAAQEYIALHKPKPIVVPADLYAQDRIDRIASVGTLEHGRPADLSIPGIVLTSTRKDGSTGYRLIDGWNRAAKALQEGKPLLAYPVPREVADYEQIWNRAKGTQKARVKEAVKTEPKSIEQVQQETGIKRENIRRILGVGTKAGEFVRVDKGVYVLTDEAGRKIAHVETADALEALPNRVKAGDKYDMIFLDPPYFSRALVGGNRGIKDFQFITPEQFTAVGQAIQQLVASPDSHVYLMLSGARTAQPDMSAYVTALTDRGFKLVGEGRYQKLTKAGAPITGIRGGPAAAERLLLLTQSGQARRGEIPAAMDFAFVRPSIAKSYTTEKPTELLTALIKQSTLEGEAILDPFAGSGVTGEAAAAEGRRVALIEKKESQAGPIQARVKKGLQKRAEIVLKSVQLLPEEAEVAGQLAEDIAAGQAGHRARTETGEWFGVPSTFPAYFKNKGYTKKEALAVIDRAIQGRVLTEKQAAMFEDLMAGKIAELKAQEEHYAGEIQRAADDARAAGATDAELEAAARRGEAEEQQEAAAAGLGDVALEEGELPEGATDFPTEEPGRGGGGNVQGLAEPLAAQAWGVQLAKDPKITERINKTQIIQHVEDTFKVPVRSKLTHTMTKLAGFYKVKEQIIRLKKWGELEVLTHELAHHIDNLMEHELSGQMSAEARKGQEQWYRKIAPQGRVKALVKELADLDYNPKERRTAEGFAEYMRHYLTDTGQAHVKAPIFHKAFTETFLPQHPELAKNLEQLRTMYRNWRDQGALARVLGQIDFAGEHTKGTLKARMEKAWNWFLTRFEDEFFVLKKVEEELGLKVGENLRPTQSPFALATAWKQKSSGIARSFVEESAVDEYGHRIGPSLSTILQPVVKASTAQELLQPTKAQELRKFIAYWVSLRAMHLEAHRGIESGFDVEDAKYLIESLETPAWRKAAEDLTTWSNHLVEWVVRAGGLTEGQAEAFRVANPIYVPFKRAFLDAPGLFLAGGKLFSSGSPFKKIHGSGRPIINPLESIVQQATQMISRSQKIAIASAIKHLAQEEGSGLFINKVPLARKATTFQLEQIYKQIMQAGYVMGKRIGDKVYPAKGGLGEHTLDDVMTVFTLSADYKGAGNVVPIFNNGKVELYELHPELFEALQGVDPIQIGGVMKVLSWFRRTLQLGATGLNATFGLIRNPIRDALTYSVFSKRKGANPLQPLVGAYQDIKPMPGSFADRFKLVGGDISSSMGYDRAQTMAVLDDALLKSLGAQGKALRIAKHPVDTLRRLINVTEMGPRIAEGTASMERYQKAHPDWTPADVFLQAFNDAQDVTINFTKSGKWGKWINQAVFPFNAQIQGLNKFYRQLADPKLRIQTVVRGIAWITLSALASWYRNKDEEWYQSLPPAYKYNNLFFEFDDQVVRVPIPFDIGIVFAAVPMAVADADYTKHPELYQGLVDLALSQVPNPTDVAALGPLVEVGLNRDYLGRPIESEGMKYLPPEQRVRPYTAQYAKLLGQAFAKVGIPLSPVQIEHIVNNYLGGLPRTAGSLANLGAVKEPSDLPVVGPQFMRTPEKPTYQLDRFYSRLESLRQRKSGELATPDEELELKSLESLNRNQLKGSRDRIREAQTEDDRGTIRLEYLYQRELLNDAGFGLQ